MKRKSWQMTLDEFVYYWSAKSPVGWFLFGATTTHRSAIERAHADGHAIPPEVLVDHPRLADELGLPHPSTQAIARNRLRKPQVIEALRAWRSNRAYWDGHRSYRLKADRRRPAPWSAAAKAIFSTPDELHAAAMQL